MKKFLFRLLFLLGAGLLVQWKFPAVGRHPLILAGAGLGIMAVWLWYQLFKNPDTNTMSGKRR